MVGKSVSFWFLLGILVASVALAQTEATPEPATTGCGAPTEEAALIQSLNTTLASTPQSHTAIYECADIAFCGACPSGQRCVHKVSGSYNNCCFTFEYECVDTSCYVDAGCNTICNW